MSVGTPVEAEYVSLGGLPLWVALLLAFDRRFNLGVAPGMLVAFVVYFLAVEEINWRIQLGKWLPPGLCFAKAHHLAHHERADQRFNVFLPLCDSFFGSLKSHTP